MRAQRRGDASATSDDWQPCPAEQPRRGNVICWTYAVKGDQSRPDGPTPCRQRSDHGHTRVVGVHYVGIPVVNVAAESPGRC